MYRTSKIDRLIQILTCFLLSASIVGLILTVQFMVQSYQGKVDEDYCVVPSSVIEDYVPPVSVLPTDFKELCAMIYEYQGIHTETQKYSLKMLDANSSIEVSLVEDPDSIVYIEYSKSYDCTVLKTTLTDEEPFKILYHFEFEDSDSYLLEIFSQISSYYSKFV